MPLIYLLERLRPCRHLDYPISSRPLKIHIQGKVHMVRCSVAECHETGNNLGYVFQSPQPHVLFANDSSRVSQWNLGEHDCCPEMRCLWNGLSGGWRFLVTKFYSRVNSQPIVNEQKISMAFDRFLAATSLYLNDIIWLAYLLLFQPIWSHLLFLNCVTNVAPVSCHISRCLFFGYEYQTWPQSIWCECWYYYWTWGGGFFGWYWTRTLIFSIPHWLYIIIYPF